MLASIVLGLALAIPPAPAGAPSGSVAEARRPVLTSDVPMARLTIPDEVAPAVAPYLRCQLLSHGVRMGPPGAQTVPTPGQLGADCSGARRESARLAERLLKRQRRGSAAERRAFVEKVLASVDDFVGKTTQLPLPPERRPDARN